MFFSKELKPKKEIERNLDVYCGKYDDVNEMSMQYITDKKKLEEYGNEVLLDSNLNNEQKMRILEKIEDELDNLRRLYEDNILSAQKEMSEKIEGELDESRQIVEELNEQEEKLNEIESITGEMNTDGSKKEIADQKAEFQDIINDYSEELQRKIDQQTRVYREMRTKKLSGK